MNRSLLSALTAVSAAALFGSAATGASAEQATIFTAECPRTAELGKSTAHIGITNAEGAPLVAAHVSNKEASLTLPTGTQLGQRSRGLNAITLDWRYPKDDVQEKAAYVPHPSLNVSLGVICLQGTASIKNSTTLNVNDLEALNAQLRGLALKTKLRQ